MLIQARYIRSVYSVVRTKGSWLIKRSTAHILVSLIFVDEKSCRIWRYHQYTLKILLHRQRTISIFFIYWYFDIFFSLKKHRLIGQSLRCGLSYVFPANDWDPTSLGSSLGQRGTDGDHCVGLIPKCLKWEPLVQVSIYMSGQFYSFSWEIVWHSTWNQKTR